MEHTVGSEMDIFPFVVSQIQGEEGFEREREEDSVKLPLLAQMLHVG